MARGTGLPLPRDDAITQVTPQASGDVRAVEAFSQADAWRQIASAGQQLQNVGVDGMERVRHQAEVGYLAENETDITRQRIEMRDSFNHDPAGFDNAWKAYSDGKLSEAESWAVPHLQKQLGQEGNTAYSSILSEKRSRDQELDAKRISTLAEQSGGEVVASAMAGSLGTSEGQAKLVKYRNVLDTAVTSNLMTPEEADLRFNDVTSRASAESAVKVVGDTYRDNRAKGLDAGAIALQQAEDAILRTDDARLSGLSEDQRYAYYHKATAEVRALEAERKQDLGEAKKAKADAEYALSQGVRVGPETIDEITLQLVGAGGHADAARLRASAARFDQISAFGRQPLNEQVAQYQGFAGAVGASVSPEIRSVIQEAADATGVPPSYLFSTASKESGFNPNARAGTSSAEGLYQFTDATWRDMLAKHGAKYGLTPDTPKNNARASALLAGELARENGEALAAAGLPVNDRTLYIAHFAGAGGATRLLQATPDSVAATILPDAAAANRSIFYAGDRPRTVSEVLSRLTSAAGGGGGPGYDLRLLSGQRASMSKKADDLWGRVKTQLDAGNRPDPVELNSIIQAATLVGDHALLEEVGERMDRFDAVQVAGQQPLSVQQGATAELQGQPGLTAGQSAWLGDLEKTAAATQDKLSKDPIALGAERFPERIRIPAPLDLSDPEKALNGLEERVGISRFVGTNYGVSDIPALGTADRTSIANAIATPTPPPENKAQNGSISGAESGPSPASVAFEVLTAVPDEFFTATLRSDEIKTAVSGAARSANPEKFTEAMTALDRMWARAPQEVQKVFGEDVIKSLQDWQGALRYHTRDELADRLKRRLDPAVAEQRKSNETAARALLKDRTITNLVDDLDPGYFVLGPDVPVDARTRDAAMADYEALFTERYAETLDQDVAHKQALERMRLYWTRSEVNGGRLSLHAPESVYPAIGGSHTWMRDQILGDITQKLGTVPDDYVVLADRMTESDIATNKPPRYLVLTKKDGVEGYDILRDPKGLPLRYQWRVDDVRQDARDAFADQRRRVFSGPIPLNSINPALPAARPQ